ncbi:MAG TPA: fatty acid CoA ligase family protein [Phycisphaerae bacterium]|nr:fatty acid CoA ligase family protein [Phycisphaerae bacterium]
MHAPAQELVNVAAWLPLRASEQPDKPAIVWRSNRDAAGRAVYSQFTFRELNEACDRHAHGLVRVGISRGTRTILMVRPSAEFFVLTFALYKIGAVPVLIDPGMGRRNMVQCLRDVNAEAFIGIPLAHALRVLNPGAFRKVRVVITAGWRWFWRGHRLRDLVGDPDSTSSHSGHIQGPAGPASQSPDRQITKSPNLMPFPMAPTSPDDPAAIIFTTGSTGPPKGVLYRHGMFDAQVRILRERFNIGPDEIDLPTFPLFALFDPALGMTAVIPEMDFTRPALVDPVKIIEAIRDNGVTHMFGSPALLDRVGRYGEAHDVALPTLRRVISAGAPVPPAALRRFKKLLSNSAQIYTPYGATEALPIAVIGSDEILGETAALTAQGLGTCVGMPVDRVEVRIIRISDEPIARWSDDLILPLGDVGEIAVRGTVVTREYITSEAATRLAKIRDDDGGVWHRMGDLGRFDENSRLWFYGRKAHRVITEHGALFTEPVEAIFNQHPKVLRSALVGVGARPRQTPVVCIEIDKAALQKSDYENPATLGEELFAIGAKHEFTKRIDTFLVHPGFPVDIRHNSKIFREKLAVWAAKRLKVK